MNIQLYFRFYADNELLQQVNKEMIFKLFKLNDLPNMIERFEKRGTRFRAGWIEIRDSDNIVLMNEQVLKSVYSQYEYDFNSIDKLKTFITKHKKCCSV